MSLWEERAARNEALFREVNEQARSLAERFGDPSTQKYGFICECSDDTCTERVDMLVQDYETVRANPRRFIVVSGHESEFEHVVQRHDGYSIVEKEGTAGQIAERTDPRTG